MQWIGWCIMLMLLSKGVQGQCTFDINADIEDLQTLELQFAVDNLLNNDLSAGQGICGIELQFRHSYIGDVTIDLVSPAGQSVQLVGAVTDQINPTNLTTWNVRFLRCGFPAAPDPGFSAQWSNNQPWQVFTTYSGSYYPADGCLEDFNLGSANGIWQLVITDHDAFQSGELIGVTLIFCDDTGLNCSVCGVDAGSFPQPMLSVCAGTAVSIIPVFTNPMPDPSSYGYQFLVSQDQLTFTTTAQVNTGSMFPGTYTICGVSYRLADSAGLFTLLDTMTFDQIQSVFSTPGLVYCAELTEGCISLEIDAPVDTTYLGQQVCAGTTVTVGGQSFSTTGTHIVSIDRNGACDSVVVLELEVVLVEARIIQEDTISCSNGITRLDGSMSIAGAGAVYQWSTQSGNILSPADQPVIQIDGTGIYVLRITDQGCTDELVYAAVGDETIPFIAVDGGIIDCNSPAFTFNTIVFPTQVVVSWSGPGGFVSDMLNPTVMNPGSYHLQVTDGGGCSASVVADVVLDTTTVQPSIVTTPDCPGASTFVSGIPGNLEYAYSWTGPNGFTNQTRQFWTNEPGIYCATLTPPNGCPSTTCIDVVADYTIPDAMAVASSDTLHCGEQTALSVSSGVVGALFAWYGPAGYFSSAQTDTVFEAGRYIGVVTAPNGCTNQDTVMIQQGSDVFEAFAFGDTLNCNVDTARIGAITFAQNATYAWSGPGLVDSSLAFVRAVTPGLYQVRISSSGCEQTLSVRVSEDFTQANFRPFTDTITCLEPIAELTILISSPYEEVRWLLPDGTESLDSVLLTTQEGLYTLLVSSANGCVGMRQIFVPTDTLPPLVFTDSDLLGCDSVQIQVISVDTLIAFQWTGPSGFTSDDLNPYVYEYGSYLLTATGSNGCTGTKTELVDTSDVRPDLEIQAELLDCIDSTAVLEMISTDTVEMYAWFSQGMQISDTSNVLITMPGLYIAVVTASNGCTAADTVLVNAPAVPEILTQTDTVTCVSPAKLFATTDIVDASFLWIDAKGVMGTGDQFSTPNSGNTTVVITGGNGCSSDTTIFVVADTLPPLAIAGTNEMILCDVQRINLDAHASLGQMLSFHWISPDGAIISGENTSFVQISGAGTYILEVMDGANGCRDTDTLEIQEETNPLIFIFVTPVSECDGGGNATISIDSVAGATTQLTYFLNGDSGGPLFEQLTQGQYLVSVMDSFGCRIDTLVDISNTSSSGSISLGEDRSIILGDSIVLEAVLDLEPSQIAGIRWEGVVSCDTCLAVQVAPLVTAVFGVFVTDVFGCIARDVVTVFVEEKPKYFIPNVFSPNGDNINDVLSLVLHPGIGRVGRFSIFDRWGNVVFHVSDVPASEVGGIQWDGIFNGKPLNPAVFVYLLDIELISGRKVIDTGTITLVK